MISFDFENTFCRISKKKEQNENLETTEHTMSYQTLDLCPRKGLIAVLFLLKWCLDIIFITRRTCSIVPCFALKSDWWSDIDAVSGTWHNSFQQELFILISEYRKKRDWSIWWWRFRWKFLIFLNYNNLW